MAIYYRYGKCRRIQMESERRAFAKEYDSVFKEFKGYKERGV